MQKQIKKSSGLGCLICEDGLVRGQSSGRQPQGQKLPSSSELYIQGSIGTSLMAATWMLQTRSGQDHVLFRLSFYEQLTTHNDLKWCPLIFEPVFDNALYLFLVLNGQGMNPAGNGESHT